MTPPKLTLQGFMARMSYAAAGAAGASIAVGEGGLVVIYICLWTALALLSGGET